MIEEVECIGELVTKFHSWEVKQIIAITRLDTRGDGETVIKEGRRARGREGEIRMNMKCLPEKSEEIYEVHNKKKKIY